MLTALAFVVLCVLVLLVVIAIVKLGQWPKRVAESRGHRYEDAVNVLSWGGLLLTAGLAWLAALVWAHAPPGGGALPEERQPDRTKQSDLEARIDELEAQLRALQA